MRALAMSSCTGSTVATIAFSSGARDRANDEGLGGRRERHGHGGGQTECEAHIDFFAGRLRMILTYIFEYENFSSMNLVGLPFGSDDLSIAGRAPECRDQKAQPPRRGELK